MAVPPRADRRLVLADAAIEVIATRGAHGLSHHAVDDQAGLARGSTSYYFRTRHDLVSAVFDRVVRLDVADLVALEAAGVPSVRDVAGLLVQWMSANGRVRTRARIEVFALAARDPVLQARLRSVTDTMQRSTRVLAAQLLPDVGRDDVDEAAFCLLSVMDGALQQWTREDRKAPSVDTVERLLRRACGAPLSVSIGDAPRSGH